MRYVLPLQMLENSIVRKKSSAGNDIVIMDARKFDLLLELMLLSAGFDDESYIQQYPDVADAVSSGKLHSGIDHYVRSGWKEKRAIKAPQVNATWYMQKYGDVAAAAKKNFRLTAQAHYNMGGYQEGRAPNEAVDKILERWRR